MGLPDPLSRLHVMLGACALLSLLLLWGWGRQLPWPNVLALAAGTGFFLGLVFYTAVWIEDGLPSALRDWPQALLCTFPLLLSSRLMAQDLWKWRAGRPYYGYELMALTAAFTLLPIFLMGPFLGLWLGLALPLVLVVFWQIAMTPWWIRKSPAPAPRDWTGPLAWVLWVGGYYWVSVLFREVNWLGLALCLAPGLWALARRLRLSAARAQPGSA